MIMHKDLASGKKSEIQTNPGDTMTSLQPSKGTLLYVDDDSELRECMSDIFEPRGYCVKTAKSAEQALRILAQKVGSPAYFCPAAAIAKTLRTMKELFAQEMACHDDLRVLAGSILSARRKRQVRQLVTARSRFRT